MHGRGDASERRTFAVVMAVVFGSVLTMMLVAPGNDANAALTAATSEAERESMRARLEHSDAAGAGRPPGPEAPVPLRELVSTAPLTDPRLASLVDDLRDDGIPGNAGKAMRALIRMPPGEIPDLTAALDSGDEQLRHFAAGVLRWRVAANKAEVSQRLLQVSIEALRNDLGRVRYDAYGTWVGPLAVKSARFLRDHAAAASAMLFRELTSTNPQQRFLSAYLLAQGGQVSATRNPDRVARVTYELVGHLADNRVTGDAAMATHGLYRIGDRALPILMDNWRYLDEQGRKLVELIRMDLAQPPRTKKDLYDRSRFVRVSPLYHDPAIEYDMHRSVVPAVRGW